MAGTSNLIRPGHCVGNALHKTARAVSRIYAEHMRSVGLHRSQFSILSELSHSGPLAIHELAESMIIDRTTLTRNLRPLERDGLVAMRKSDADARVRVVSLTPSGSEKLKEARVAWRKAQRHVVREFGEENWRRLEKQLEALREIGRQF